MLAVYVIGSMGLSNWACVYLDFPVQVILKSSKIIFVMIAGKFIQNVRYSWVQYSAAILMIFGIVVFTVENIAISPRFNYAGILIMMFALIGDSFMGNNQERVMKKYRPTQSEMVHYIYLIASMIILALILISGEFFHFFDYALKNKTIFLMIVPFGAVGYVGSATVLILIELFGVHIAVTTTTLRKFFTILTSFFIFSKPFTWKYLIGVFLVFSGIGLNIWYKKRQEMLKESMVSFTNSNNGKMNV
ncbi:adenosine 3'-phospho 5'-phosphosulfate transporter 2 [Anaeramoeba ignava]|uniref:Adenosine 3'-phospho 5'-phosphosulfate transporter 2 n=1 Tax=Anaeramoeba ignava TaxID=1746090 RepID=A0A9Q0L647_ANAIG|nr:adenosine 3'-phospho 5'-phosphosulfate transporter 2 [Anaeramoeba ignava]